MFAPQSNPRPDPITQIKFLSSADLNTRRHLAARLSESGESLRSVIPAICSQLLSESDSQVVFSLVSGLAKLGEVSQEHWNLLQPAIEWLFTGEDVGISTAAAFLCGKCGIGKEGALWVLIDHLLDEREEVREMNTVAIGMIGHTCSLVMRDIAIQQLQLAAQIAPDFRASFMEAQAEIEVHWPESQAVLNASEITRKKLLAGQPKVMQKSLDTLFRNWQREMKNGEAVEA